MALKRAAFTLCDYLLPVSFSRHAAQPPSPVSRRDAGSCRPTRRIASITSSAGMISPTPESARFAAHTAFATPTIFRYTHGTKSAAFTPRDYFLPVSFSRHAAQPPSPVSRRDAGSCLPTRRIASITSSAGMISPTPEIAGVRGAWR